MNKDTQLLDNHGRPMRYLRLAVTDRCNLRCTYCMPAEGISYMPLQQLLTWEEMFRVTRILHDMGIEKVRITGGEPFVRPGLMDFLRDLSALNGLDVCLTTNGVLIEPHLDALFALGIRTINVSLDSLDRERFHAITRRDDFDVVMANIMRMLSMGFQVKLNAVIMRGKNEEDMLALTQFAADHPVSVRFIEEMPFNGSGLVAGALYWNDKRMLAQIKSGFPDLVSLPKTLGETAQRYRAADFKGDIGIIAAYSRTFCGTCNRVRLTAKGQVKTCLYDEGVFDLKAYLRSGVSDAALRETFLILFNKRPIDGFAAEKNRKGVIDESMTTIGG